MLASALVLWPGWVMLHKHELVLPWPKKYREANMMNCTLETRQVWPGPSGQARLVAATLANAPLIHHKASKCGSYSVGLTVNSLKLRANCVIRTALPLQKSKFSRAT
jgi:hypothetical protein